MIGSAPRAFGHRVGNRIAFGYAMQPLLNALTRWIDPSCISGPSITSECADVCPRCGASSLCRSYTRWHERWRKILGSRPYRCQACLHRAWRRPFPEHTETIPPEAIEVLQPSLPLNIDLKALDSPAVFVRAPNADSYLAYASLDWQIRALIGVFNRRLAEVDGANRRRFAGRSLSVKAAALPQHLRP